MTEPSELTGAITALTPYDRNSEGASSRRRHSPPRFAIAEEAKPSEAQEHHRPARRLGYRQCRAERRADEPNGRIGGVHVEADYIALVIDPVGRHGRGPERIDRSEHAAFVEEAEHVFVRERIVSDYPTMVVDSERLRGYRTRERERLDYSGRIGKCGENSGAVRAFLVEAGNFARIVHAGRLAVGVLRQQMVDVRKDRATCGPRHLVLANPLVTPSLM
jgi:hypothetical protein